jgi:uncharacterized protein (DUF58 family)
VTRRLDGELKVAALAIGLAVAGWWIHSTLLAMAGVVAALTTLVLWVSQRECLTGVGYRRTLAQHRATFGEEVALDIELINDKLLPLTWLHVEDSLPMQLTIHGGSVVNSRSDRTRDLQHVLPMLPFQRVRRHLVVVCDHRGTHRFGPARLRSGDPIGYRQRHGTAPAVEEILVYPKIFRLDTTGVASRVPLGDHRSSLRLLGDPSRVSGVREYRAGDPLRHVDWRATARSTSLLVREFEPTASLRVAVFVDMTVPQLRWDRPHPPELEFTVAVAASVVSDLAGRRVPVGLYSAATVEGRGIAQPPSASPAALPQMLELLARAAAFGTGTFAQALIEEGSRLQRGNSLVVVAADYPEPTLVALAELRRRLPVTAIWVATDQGSPPPPELVDARWEARYAADWPHQDSLELAS